MPVEIDRWRGGDPRPFFEAVSRAFTERLHPDDAAVWADTFESDRALAGYDGDRVVATAGTMTMELSVPGATLPCAGVTSVGVHATHRRRGLLRQMMRRQLDDVHTKGEPLAALWASESNIYGRFGYGLATLRGRLRLERDRSQFREPLEPTGQIRWLDLDEAKNVLPRIHDEVRPRWPGFFSRTPSFWAAEVFHDPEHWRRGASEAWYVVHETDGTPDAYVKYRVHEDWDELPKSQLRVSELISANPTAHLETWRFLLDIDLIARIEAWSVPVDEPLLLNLAEPRRAGMAIGDALWLRLVDAGAALSARSYRGSGRVVIALRDEFCAWNAGRWAVTVADGTGVAARSTLAPDLAVDTADLAAAYLGAFTFTQLAAARRAAELQPGALDRADALFRVDRAPWCPTAF